MDTMKKASIVIAICAWILIVVFAVTFLVFRFDGQSTPIKEETIALREVNSIVVQCDTIGVEFVSTSAGDMRVTQYGRPNTALRDIFTVDVSNGRALISIKNDFRVILFDPWITREVLIIEIPATWNGNVEVSLKSGGVKLRDDFQWKGVKLASTSGSINIGGRLLADSLFIKASSGSIKAIEELAISGDFKVECTSGGINLRVPINAQDVFIEASSGSITLDAVNASNLSLSSTSGDIRVVGALDIKDTLSVKCGSGGISINVPVTADKVFAKASSGGIRLGEVQTKNFDLSSSSGSINITGISGTGNIHATSGGITVMFHGPLGEATLSSGSGSIRISVDKSLSFNFDGQCTSGSVRANFPLLSSNDGRKASATVGNNPKASITATASSGGISINQ
jgi:DUF4097 and DUF4098 domain-containing protein YvlB